MKNAASVLALAFICTTSVLAQEADELSLSLYANTASPLMLGANYQLADRIHIRTSLGYSQYTQEFSQETSDDDRTVRWYGGAIAGLYHLPDMWRFQPYAGVELQYVYARANASSPITERMANDRFDAGGLVGVEVRMTHWLGIFGEAGLGYASGYETNSIAGFRQRTSGFGLTRAGLGLQVHFGRATR